MNKTMTTIEQNVMRQVRRIAILRIVISGGIFALSLGLIALYFLGREVWVARVFENGPQDLMGQALYLVYAFEHTRFVVQALVVICLGAAFYLAHEVRKLLLVLTPPRV